MIPTYQRLEAGQSAMFEIEDRLVVRREFSVFKSVIQIGFQLESSVRLAARFLISVANFAGITGSGHGLTTGLDKFLSVFVVLRTCNDADPCHSIGVGLSQSLSHAQRVAQVSEVFENHTHHIFLHLGEGVLTTNQGLKVGQDLLRFDLVFKPDHEKSYSNLLVATCASLCLAESVEKDFHNLKGLRDLTTLGCQKAHVGPRIFAEEDLQIGHGDDVDHGCGLRDGRHRMALSVALDSAHQSAPIASALMAVVASEANLTLFDEVETAHPIAGSKEQALGGDGSLAHVGDELSLLFDGQFRQEIVLIHERPPLVQTTLCYQP